MTNTEFETLWRSHFPRLVRYCQFRTATVEEAKDVAAETFTRLYAQDRTPRDVLPIGYNIFTDHKSYFINRSLGLVMRRLVGIY